MPRSMGGTINIYDVGYMPATRPLNYGKCDRAASRYRNALYVGPFSGLTIYENIAERETTCKNMVSQKKSQ